MRTVHPMSRAILLALLAGAPLAHASDSSDTMRVGDMQYGNGLDPRGWSPLMTPDPNGMSWLHPGMLRTPSGALYPYPYDFAGKPLGQGGDWTYWGLLQLGYIHVGGDSNAEFFRQYTDWKNGAALGLFALGFDNPHTGSYVEFRGSRISSDDQYYRLRAGRYGHYKFQAFYRDIPHAVSTNAFPIWDGIGTSNLTLPAGLTPGGSTIAAVQAASAAAPRRTIGLTRTRTGLSLEGELYRDWIGFASVTNEERDGTRLWGGPMFFNYPFFTDTGSPFGGDGGIMETVRPIDFTTTDVNIGLRRVGKLWHFNALYNGSFFRDHKSYLDYQNPFLITNVIGVPNVAPVTNGEYSLEPDNDYHNLRLELSRQLKWRGELSLAAAYGTMRQNDALLPPVNCTGTLGFTAGPLQQLIPCDLWNTPAALSRTHANARIDTQLFDAKLTFHPGRNFGWHAELRYYDEDNKTRYLAFNPLTGQYGYISENGAQGSVVPGETGIFDNGYYATSNVQIASVPFGYRDTLLELGADWNVGESDSLSLVYTFDHNQPRHRERTRLDEQRIKLSWVSRSLGDATLRASFEYGDRSGGTYNYDPYEAYYSESLPGFVNAGGIPPPAFTVDAMRKYDMSDRKEAKARVILIYPLGDTSTVSATFYGSRDQYDALVGRQDTHSTGFTGEWDWQPGPQTNASVYVGAETTKLKLANVADDESAFGGPGRVDPSFGGTLYPLENYWHDLDRERDYNAGITFAHDFGRVKLDLAWNYTQSLSQLNYDFASPGALTFPDAAPLLTGAFPDNHYRSSTFDAGLSFPVTESIGVRLFGRYQSGSFLDWHYLGFDDTLVYDHRIYTDRGPQLHYRATLVGAMLSIKL